MVRRTSFRAGKPPEAEVDRRTSLACELQQSCRGCSSPLACDITRFILQSYQQFTVGRSLLSKTHPSIYFRGHVPAYWGDSSVVLMIRLTYAFPLGLILLLLWWFNWLSSLASSQKALLSLTLTLKKPLLSISVIRASRYTLYPGDYQHMRGVSWTDQIKDLRKMPLIHVS